LIIILILSVISTSCKKEATGVRIITTFDTGPIFSIGASIKFQAIVIPENARNISVIWTSGNSSVATITKGGEMLTVGIGTSTIICTTEDGKHSDSMEISVVENYAANIAGIYKGTITIDDGVIISGIPLNMVNSSAPSNHILISFEHSDISISCRAIISKDVSYDLQGNGYDNDYFSLIMEGRINPEATSAYLVFTVNSEPPKSIVFRGDKE
jgi:uncharacterized protein YjdB